MGYNVRTGQYEPDEPQVLPPSPNGSYNPNAPAQQDPYKFVYDGTKNPQGVRVDNIPVSTTPTGSPTINDIYNGPNQTPTDVALKGYGDYYKGQAEADVPTEDSLYAEKLRLAQAEIDATNRIYADMLRATQQKGKELTGSAGARQARAGLLGSERGAAIDTNTANYNREQENSVLNEQNLKIQEILGRAKQGAAEEVAAKRAAKEAGYQKYIEYISAADTRNKSKITGLAQTLLAQGIDVSKLSDADLNKLATGYGIDKTDIVSAYNTAKQAQDKLALEKTKTEAEISNINSTVADRNRFSLSEGQKQFTIDPKTGEVKEIAAVKKTYAPKATGGGGTGAGGSGAYGNDLDAIIGVTISTIPTKFGQEQFRSQLARARNDGDKINLVAAQVLKGQPGAVRTDFANQSVAIKNIDKAISVIDQGAKTGYLNAGTQYAFNVFGKDFDPKLAAIDSYLTSAIQPYRNSVTGAAWGGQEDGEYAQLFGSTKFSPAELKDRLVRVKEILKDKSIQGLNAFVNPLDVYSNQFQIGGYAPTQTPTVAPTIITAPNGDTIQIID